MSFIEPNPHPKWSRAWLAVESAKTMLEIRMASLPECDALIAAGWKYELPEIVNGWYEKYGDVTTTEPWQWYWRSPPKRAGGKGRKYLSTTQAFNALKRTSTTPPTPQPLFDSEA